MHVLNAVAQLERDLIIERTNSGVARARAEGKRFGRPPAVAEAKHAEILAALRRGDTLTSIARQFDITRQTITRLRDRYAATNARNEKF